MRFHLFCAILLLAGCTSPHALDERWRPLVEIVERPDLLVGGRVTTIGTRVYVPSLSEFLKKRPPGSVEFEALMLHEREHAIRQLEMGLGPWLARYLNDVAFMRREEQVGWYQELTHLRRFGVTVYPRVEAKALAGYANLAGSMIGYAEALAWIEDVLDGSWTPEQE